VTAHAATKYEPQRKYELAGKGECPQCDRGYGSTGRGRFRRCLDYIHPKTREPGHVTVIEDVEDPQTTYNDSPFPRPFTSMYFTSFETGREVSEDRSTISKSRPGCRGMQTPREREAVMLEVVQIDLH